MAKPLLRVLLALCLLIPLLAVPLPPPLQRQQTPPDVEPDAELLPSGPTPSPSASPIPPSPLPVPPAAVDPPAESPPSTPAASPAPTAASSPQASPSAGAAPSVSAAASPPSGDRLPPPAVPIPGDTNGDGVQDDFDGDGEPDEPSPTPESDIEGADSSRAALAGGLTGGLFALVLLALCIFCVFFRSKRDDQPSGAATGTGTGVYTSTEAGVASAERDAAAAGATPLDTDAARNAGPAVAAGVGAAASGSAAAVVAALPSEEGSLDAIPPRGPTPPPHDYVLGAGPAGTRADFVDIRTKFERDEIGDNSAVLGVERGGVVGEGLEMDISEQAAESGFADTGAAALAHETRKVPDRGEVPVTFESQERLMAGGDGSGAISDAAMSLTAASIAEESGDVPSLERDPIVRDRDETF